MAHHTHRRIASEARVYFRDELRLARLGALRDAEDFHGILFALERLGSFLRGKPASGLKAYRSDLLLLAGKGKGPVADVEVEEVFDLVHMGRNEALHQGAYARHLTANAIRLAIYLEDALVSELPDQAKYFMVPNPTCAELWHPLNLVRQAMLANSFSYLPVQHTNEWKLIGDARLAAFLRSRNRSHLLTRTLGDAVVDGLLLDTPTVLRPNESVAAALKGVQRGLYIVVAQEDESRLLGIISPFDLL